MNTFCNKKLLMSNYERKSVKMWCYTSISRNADNSYFYIKKRNHVKHDLNNLNI